MLNPKRTEAGAVNHHGQRCHAEDVQVHNEKHLTIGAVFDRLLAVGDFDVNHAVITHELGAPGKHRDRVRQNVFHPLEAH